jgi:hypothetical protein
MKLRLERITLGLILAPLAPLAALMVCWWTAYLLLPDAWIPFLAITGLVCGILVDILILKKLLDHRLSGMFWVVVFLFYSTGVFGLFMGVPIFNALLAIPAGFVAGGRLVRNAAGKSQIFAVTRQTCILTTIILAFICAASAILALGSPSTAADLEGMLALPFAVTQVMIWGLIIIGGSCLLAFNWALTAVSVHLARRILAT